MTLQKGAVETQRLFFALWPDTAMQQRVATTAAALLPVMAGERTRSESLHCTLVFVGNVDRAQRFCIEDAASQVRARPFTLTLDHLGYFKRPRVAWLGCTTTPASLQSLATDLQAACSRCGLETDRRPYTVHLTVARKLMDPGRLRLLPIDWAVNQYALVESVSGPDGVRYRPLRFWNL